MGSVGSATVDDGGSVDLRAGDEHLRGRRLGIGEVMGVQSRRVVRREAVGVVAAITPWNFPNQINLAKIGPALAAGCTVVVKPASLTPLSTLHLVRLLEEVGLPAGVVNVLTTTDSKGTSEALFADPRLRKLSFTGSTPVGVSLLKQAAALLHRGAVMAVPTDSSYALACHLDDKAAAERLRRLRGVDERHHLTLVCRDLSELATYARVDNQQYRLLKLLSGVRGAFTAVGDDDQAIYAWRGADVENLKLLQQDYPKMKVIKLEQNYRSSRRILEAANTVIANTASRSLAK